MFTNPLFDYLFNVAPVVGIMGIAVFTLWKTNREQLQYTREADKANLETLIDLKNLLQNYLIKTASDKNDIISSIKEEAKEVKNHVDYRIEIIRAKGVGSNEK